MCGNILHFLDNYIYLEPLKKKNFFFSLFVRYKLDLN